MIGSYGNFVNATGRIGSTFMDAIEDDVHSAPGMNAGMEIRTTIQAAGLLAITEPE